jgi:hypothetical protein
MKVVCDLEGTKNGAKSALYMFLYGSGQVKVGLATGQYPPPTYEELKRKAYESSMRHRSQRPAT